MNELIDFIIDALSFLFRLNNAVILLVSLFLLISICIIIYSYRVWKKCTMWSIFKDIFHIILALIICTLEYFVAILLFGKDTDSNGLFLLWHLFGVLCYYMVGGITLAAMLANFTRDDETITPDPPEVGSEAWAQARIREIEKNNPNYAKFLRRARESNRGNRSSKGIKTYSNTSEWDPFEHKEIHTFFNEKTVTNPLDPLNPIELEEDILGILRDEDGNIWEEDE